MRLLIYGAGVIGSLYGALLSESGNDVTVYARGNRLQSLLERGLQYKSKKSVKKASVNVISHLEPEDYYDFIFLAVRETQLYTALNELNENKSPTIVTMVNSIDRYEMWENICGKGRIFPAFPGAGGGFDNGILDAKLTPRMIQRTTLAEIDGRKSERLKSLVGLFKKAGIPYQIVSDMHVWQICHLGMVVPIADAYYESDNPEQVGKDKRVMQKTARQIRQNFIKISEKGIALSPRKMCVFKILPIPFLAFGLRIAFQSEFGDRFMYRHSMKASDEMQQLHKQFYGYLNTTSV